MSSRFRHLLVPVDLSDADAATFDLVIDLAERGEARVTLLHVIEAIDADPDEELKQFYESLEAKAKQRLAEITERFRDTGLPVFQEIVYGKRVAQIVRFSIEHEVELIVMRSQRVDLENPGEQWQSLSHQVSLLSQCPVLLLK